MHINVHEISESNEYESAGFAVFPNSVFIAHEWLECFRNSIRKPIYLSFVSEGKTVGVTAGLTLESPNRLLRKLYRPIFFFSGPSVVQSDKPLVSICMEALVEFASHHGYSRLLFYSWDYPQIFKLETSPIIIHTRQEYIIDLRDELNIINKKVRPYIKRHVRRAINSGATFHESDSADLVSELLFLLEETKKMRVAKGHGPYSYYYMPFLDDKIIFEMVRRRKARIFYVLKKSEVLSAELLVTHAKRAYTLLNATSPEGYKVGANPFLKMMLIDKMKRDGFEFLNLGGVPGKASGSSLAFYKLSCGARCYMCMGGSTKFLNGFIAKFNPFLSAYGKLDRESIKRVLGSRIVEKVRLVKTNLNW